MAAPPMIPRYIISRHADPLFAIFIGCSAALLRIRKEETEKRSGLPSASMVVSPQQSERMEVEREETRRRVRKSKLEMYRPRVVVAEGGGGGGGESGGGGGGGGGEGGVVDEENNGSGGGFEDGWWGSGRERFGRGVKRVEVGNMEVLRMFWERVRWKVDYEWNGRRKEVERKDGKLV